MRKYALLHCLKKSKRNNCYLLYLYYWHSHDVQDCMGEVGNIFVNKIHKHIWVLQEKKGKKKKIQGEDLVRSTT